MLRQVSRVAFRTNLASRAVQRPLMMAAKPSMIARPAMSNFVRMYSSYPSGLNREDVEKRIVNVFKSFDKVSG